MEQQKTLGPKELTERLGLELRKRKLFRKLEEFTKTEGLNDGTGYSYSYIRKVLLYPDYGHKNQRIVLAGYDLLWRMKQEEEKNEQLIVKKAEKVALTA